MDLSILQKDNQIILGFLQVLIIVQKTTTYSLILAGVTMMLQETALMMLRILIGWMTEKLLNLSIEEFVKTKK